MATFMIVYIVGAGIVALSIGIAAARTDDEPEVHEALLLAAGWPVYLLILVGAWISVCVKRVRP